ncbi:hypothetical protein KKD70_02040 [Patescibacteria group bacterium]|nr:hypothetical protein [Patescibacteria group bacterium]
MCGRIKITIVITIVLTLTAACNDHGSSSWTGTNIASDNQLVVYNITGTSASEVLLNQSGPTTMTVVPGWATVLVVEDDFELESSSSFSAWEIAPGSEGELYSLVRSYWGLASTWSPNLDPSSLRQVGDLELLLEALICSGGGDPPAELEDYLDIECPGFFIPASLFREIATEETTFSLDYPGQRVIFLFYQ